MIRGRLDEALKASMLERDVRAVSTLRLILAALKDRDIAERGRGNHAGLDDHHILSLLQSMVKQRQESNQGYERGGRADLARQEAEEIAVIERFLPPPMDDREMREVVATVIAELDGKSLRDMGRIMTTLKERYAGRIDFAAAGAVVKERLG
ncbi:MAG: GatB/YqeY domain-containing protein [Rhodospirillales bacterium]